MSVDKAIVLLNAALLELAPPAPATVVLSTPDALDRALAAAVAGDVLTLAPSLVYSAPLVLRSPVTLQVGSLAPGRMTVDYPLPRFLNGITLPADGVVLKGVEARHTFAGTDIVTFAGANVVLDRVRILGDPIHGAKRGVGANGNGGCGIFRSYIDDCFQPSPGFDAQAICAWDMGSNGTPGSGLIIEDNFLRAGSETVMLGGADSSSLERMPADVIIRNNLITARPEWQGMPIGVKTRLELKACRRVTIEGNKIEHCWIQGQSGYLISITVKNQDGAAPWSTIEDVAIQHNDLSDGPAAFNLLATDYAHPSDTMKRVRILNNRVAIASPQLRQESHKLIQILQGTVDCEIAGNVFTGQYIGSLIYFEGTGINTGLKVTDNKWPANSLYGIFGSGSAFGQAWANHVSGGTLSGNVEV